MIALVDTTTLEYVMKIHTKVHSSFYVTYHTTLVCFSRSTTLYHEVMMGPFWTMLHNVWKSAKMSHLKIHGKWAFLYSKHSLLRSQSFLRDFLRYFPTLCNPTTHSYEKSAFFLELQQMLFYFSLKLALWPSSSLLLDPWWGSATCVYVSYGSPNLNGLQSLQSPGASEALEAALLY